jgi:hypothetical protein
MTSAWFVIVKRNPCSKEWHRYYIIVRNTVVVKPKVFILVVDKRHEVFRIGPIVQLIQTFEIAESDATRTVIIVLLIWFLVSAYENYGNINYTVGDLHDFPEVCIVR